MSERFDLMRCTGHSSEWSSEGSSEASSEWSNEGSSDLMRCTEHAHKGHFGSSVAPCMCVRSMERWGVGVETQKNVRGEIGGWGRVPFNETYAPSLSTIYDGA